jgi:hypothetical protein
MTNTRKLLEHWQPPEGAGEPIACLTTTFTFEPDFFAEDCLSRFLGLDTRPGEDDKLLTLIEEEERLSETTVTVLVDRTHSPVQRNLRWDLLAVGLRGGVMHAKATVLLWKSFARFIIASANLTRAGYRHQIETAAVLDLDEDTTVPGSVFTDLIAAIRQIAELAEDDPGGEGPKTRALRTLRLAQQRVQTVALPARPMRGDPRLAIAFGRPGQPVLPQVSAVWSGGPPNEAAVLSPYFDSGANVSKTVDALGAELNRRDSALTVTIPLDVTGGQRIARAPKELHDTGSRSLEVRVQTLKSDGDERRLHGKAILLLSEAWIAGMVGSSNFTSPGLAVGNPANFEINLCVGAPRSSKVGKGLWNLWDDGDPLNLDDATWEPMDAEEETVPPPAPWGFRSCLFEPSEPQILIVRVRPKDLPPTWRIEIPGGPLVASNTTWESSGSPDAIVFALGDSPVPYWIEIHWEHAGVWQRAGMPVNVTTPGKLPLIDELRNMPARVLLDALASTRPIHEALVQAILRRKERVERTNVELDPLKRYAGSGRLLRRAKEMSAAFVGLRKRLERPLASHEALDWRLRGPFGPVEIARSVIRDAEGEGWVEGEIQFALAELVLTLSRVEWTTPTRQVTRADADREVAAVVEEIRALADALDSDPLVASYTKRAFKEAVK